VPKVRPSRYEHRHTTANEIGRQLWQTTVLTLGPAVFNRNILALDITAACLQARAERCYQVLGLIGRPAAEEADHRGERITSA